MSEVKIGDIVYLKVDPSVEFSVVANVGEAVSSAKGIFRLIRFDKANNNAVIEITAHKDSLIIKEK